MIYSRGILVVLRSTYSPYTYLLSLLIYFYKYIIKI